ncbi:arylesterase [Alkalilimnicola ehrlichii]|uniref:Arylesterase n=1 Tax=Alkalilimnicola ehrlichii TaxID=351052 RepID=A0A3E0X0Z4_9GAMM|nr:arylesterase [Alkalilimnicola ehrlichii]RFA31409.1 arylesterase [Alkalilimnicola ehrlichii]RFA39319.1 arylesterase [Alkalilimnicola ehrlichii]
MRKRFLLVLLLLFGTGPAWADRPVLMVLGDSLSASYGMPTEAGWVALLEERLQEQGYPHRVVNASISGDTTAGGLARLPRALERHQPDVLFIELGGNDGLRGIPPQETERNLARMIELGRTAGAEVLLAEIRLPPNYGAAFSERFEAMFRDLTAEHSIALVPFIPDDLDEHAELVQDDGIHPTAQAQPLLLDKVWPVLEPSLRATADR